jgi:hypothetical protein
MKAEHGVLQDSGLRPLLFLLYVKGLTNNVQLTKVALFADKTNLLITRKDEFDLQHKIINELEIWLRKNNLIINSDAGVMSMLVCRKTTTLIFLDLQLVLYFIDGTCIVTSDINATIFLLLL